ncbi:hypothetical protein RAD15_08645 [Bradyrhizobium sp. 14AA]
MPMIPFRRVFIDGPDFGLGDRVWRARVNLGHPFDARKDVPVVRNHSIRLLSQAAIPSDATIVGEKETGKKTTASFHEPLLLTAAIATRKFGTDDEAAAIDILSATFDPVQLEGEADRYSELHVVPAADWPDGVFEKIAGYFELTAPRLRATSGAIRVGYANPAQYGKAQLSARLSMNWTPLPTGRVNIFGALQIDTFPTENRYSGQKARAVAFELVPEGVEFDAWVPNPFKDTIELLQVRLRLAVSPANGTGMRLDLVGGPGAQSLSEGLAWMSRDLAARGGNVVLQVDTRGVPPLSWPLDYDKVAKAYTCGAPQSIPAVQLRPDGIGVKLLTRADPSGGEPGVADLVRHVATLRVRKPSDPPVLRIEARSDANSPLPASKIAFSWTDPPDAPRPAGGNPDTVTVQSFSGTAASESLATRLSKVWGDSGAIPTASRPPFAFVALDRGWVQIPLPDPPAPDAEEPASASVGPSAFAGLMRVDVPIGSAPAAVGADGTSWPGLSIVSSANVSLTITWSRALDGNASRTITVELYDPYGTLDGVLWAGEGSPSPVEVLPPRDAGPASLDSIPIVFGGRNISGWKVEVGKIDARKLGDIGFPLPLLSGPESGPPLLVWHANSDIAMVSSVAMTRTAESAIRPSATRELVPTQVGRSGRLVLNFGDGTARLPRAVVPFGTSVHGDGSWRWPWPSRFAAGQDPYLSSPREAAGVAVAALTLPGVEFTLGEGAEMLSSDESLLVSLRYDLPILDELFANAKAPDPKAVPVKKEPAQETRPTALDLRGLSNVWFENARRIARARTEVDRVVQEETDLGNGQFRISLWHSSNAEMKNGSVRGLVEPYVWKPDAFAFKVTRAGQNVNLGAFCLGSTAKGDDWFAGTKALGGLTANYRIEADNRLVQDGAGLVKIDGFASSSFKASPKPAIAGDPDQLHDARGLSLAFDPNTSSAVFTTRDISVRQAPDDRRLMLATRCAPIPLAIGPNELRFWFRDIPLQKNGNKLVFDRSGVLETGAGPDPEGINRNRVAKTLYEWRFYPRVGADDLGEFEIPLGGPLVARPLRLVAFEMRADSGAPSLLQILASVKLAGAKPEAGSPKQMVFGAENAYGSGNLVLLKFDDSAGAFEFREISQVIVGDSADDPFPASPTAELVFRATAAVKPVSEVPIALSLKLKANGGGVDIATASLTARLFGQACMFGLRSAAFSADGVTAFSDGDPGTSPLQLKRIDLAWPKVGSPSLTLTSAKLRAPLRNEDPKSPFAFERDYGADNVRWLELTSARPWIEEIDHDAGVVRMAINDTTEISELFRGFLLPAGRLRAVIAFVFKRTMSGTVGKWPVADLGSAFAEFAFDAQGEGATTQRIKSIRHRHTGRSSPQVAWSSSLRIDADFAAAATSSIGWPVGHASVDKPKFDALPGNKDDWKAVLTMDPKKSLALEHKAMPRLSGHQLPLNLLIIENARVVLNEPWLFRAVVDHELTPIGDIEWPGSGGKAPLAWTSIDELSLFDMNRLARAARSEFQPTNNSSDYAFMARYRDGGNEADIRIAGVVRRALANAGFPVRAILEQVRNSYPRDDSPVPNSLLLTGSSVTEAVTTSAEFEFGVSFVPQWILPWAQTGNEPTIAPLDKCPQAGTALSQYSIAAYDAAAAAPRRLDGPTAKSFSAQDGTQSLVEERFGAVVAASAAGATATMAVDQFFLEKKNNVPANLLERPLFVRTLLALSTVAEAFGRTTDKRRFGQALRCVVPSQDTPRREVKFTVTAWPRDGGPLDVPQPAVTLLVADDRSVGAEMLPAGLSATLSDPSSDELSVQGPQRADAALRAFGLSAAPRIVMLARVDTSYLTIHDAKPGKDAERTTIGDAMMPLPHVDWKFAEVTTPGLVGQPSLALRDRAVTIYASPALGWPNDERIADLAQAHARLGGEEVRRSDHAWAGRVRSVSWSAKAWGLEEGPEEPQDVRDGEEAGNAAFIAVGQRTAFRRRAAKNFRSPPDRLTVLAPPRARAPTVESMVAAFRDSRIPGEPAKPADRSRLAPLLPGQVEITTTGQRPGAMMTLHEGVLLTWPHAAFDPEFARFGRPAARGPLIARQLRAPRSSVLPDEQDLQLRRRTFIAGDEVVAGSLKPFKLVEGPAVVARFDRSLDEDDRKLNPRSVTLTVDSPSLGWLSPTWDGRIRLVAKVPGDMPARIALARIGLLPPRHGDPMTYLPHVTLQVGPAVIRFQQMVWGETIDQGTHTGDPNAKRLLVEFGTDDGAAREAARSAILIALREASADTPMRLTVRCGTPIPATTADTALSPDPHEKLTLAPDRPAAAGGDEDLIPGPPNVLVFDLPHIPPRRRWLPIVPFTLAFGDPAYDRELGSPARTNVLAIDDVPHVLAVDRAEYDVGATIHLAFWKRERKTDAPIDAPTGAWLLKIELVPREGGPARPLGITATATNAIRYQVKGCRPYAVSIASLREVQDGTPLNDVPARLSAGDRLRITILKDDISLAVDVGIVAEAVLPPPASSYGLATLQAGGPSVGTALFATAPLPQKIDFPDLLGDLVAGHVRRRALFLWPFVVSRAPRPEEPFAYLVKVDRTGGGQQPNALSDFAAYDA